MLSAGFGHFVTFMIDPVAVGRISFSRNVGRPGPGME
jgi:hypothetical protein